MLQVQAPAPAIARSARVAILLLALCCLMWGASFPVMQIGTSAFARLAGAGKSFGQEVAAQATFNGWRFGLAALIYALLTFPRQRGYTRRDVQAGAMVGLLFSGGMILQVVGLRYTLPSISGFLTCLTVLFTPLAQAAIFRRRVGPTTWLAVPIALGGMILLSWPNPTARAGTLALVPPVRFLGEFLTIAGALFFTAQIITLDRLGPSADAARLTTVMLAITAAINLPVALALGAGRFHAPNILASFAVDGTFLWTMAILVLLSGAFAIHLMNTFQPLVCPATASVIYCLEPLFATMFSLLLGTEPATILILTGGALLLFAALLVTRAPSPSLKPRP